MDQPWKKALLISCLLLVSWFGYGTHLPTNFHLLNTDNEPPVITSPAISSVLSCGSPNVVDSLQSWFMNRGHAEATDNNEGVSFVSNIDLNTTISIFESSTDTLCGNTMEVFVTWRAIDSCGNLSVDSTIASFSTVDTIAPSLTTLPVNVEVPCDLMTEDSLVNWINNYGGATATDECADSLNWSTFLWSDSNGNNGFGFFNQGPYIPVDRSTCDWSVNVSFLVLDLCGNVTPTTGTFSIIDTIGPSFTSALPTDTIVLCNSIPDTTQLEAFDLCDGILEVIFSETSTQSEDSLSCDYYDYEITRTWLAEDACGHQISYDQIISVVDTVTPGFNIPPDITIDCRFLDSLDIVGQPFNLIDNCSVIISSYEDNVPAELCDFDLERTWTVSDACGNSSTFIQQIHVEDNLPPLIISPATDVMVTCDSLFNVDLAFAQWLNNLGEAQIAQDCGTNFFFTAVPGSYVLDDPTTYPGDPVGGLDSPKCPTDLLPFARYESVDFVFYDECGNATVTQGTFGLIDTIAPIVENCPSDYLVANSEGQCSANITLLPPDASDNCGQSMSPYVETIQQQIVSPIPGDNEAVVDSLVFSFGPINLNNTQANGGIELIIDLSNVDIDDPTEFFIIKGEDGSIIDSTETTGLQCDDLTITINSLTLDQINAWASDGFIDIWLVPNVVSGGGVFSINDVCGGSFATVSLSFDIDLSNALTYGVRIDQGALFNIGPPQGIDTILEVGVHEIEHVFTDCSGNMTSCVQLITIEDTELPNVTCPNDILRILPEDSCVVSITMPNDFQFEDNCFGSNAYDESIPSNLQNAFLTFSESPVTNTLVADNEQFSFSGVSPVIYSNKMPLLDIILSGDISNSGEYFTVFSETGEFLGRTQTGTQCGVVGQTRFEFNLTDFNNWAIDGQVDFTLVSNIDMSVEGGGINPCDSIDQNTQEDGVSFVQARLRYGDARPRFYTTGATEYDTMSFPVGAGQPILDFNVGLTQVTYIFSDLPGNEVDCSFEIVVQDEQAPVVECQNLVINIHPSGLEDYVILPQEIELMSMDNCGIDSTSISPNGFTCDDVGQTVIVDYYVFDKSGNSSSCQSEVKIESTLLMPSFSAGICEGDTLKLFANVPEASVQNAYSYQWNGPQNFSSNLENPIIVDPDPSYSGTYTLEVEGFNGCISSGTVEVTIEQLVTPEIELSANSVCTGDDVLLNATSFTGEVNYLWYEGVFPSGILLASTQGPSLVLNPTIGDHFYYVIVESANCTTNPSTAGSLMVLDPPVASVTEPFITICEGDDLVLSTDEFNAGYEYSWTGPDNYMSSGQFPDVLENVSLENQGEYNLVITLGTCISDTAIASVVIFNKPDQPIISGNEVYCQGNTVLLSVNNIPNADLYTWFKDGVLFNTTVSNNLIIPSASTDLSGDWTVIIESGSCSSDPSDPQTVSVEEQIIVGASNNGPLCEGDMVQLSATFIPNTLYLWEAPDGTEYSGQNPLVPAQEGDYILTIMTSSGCESSTSTNVEINSPPTITALSNNSSTCMDGFTSVEFFPSVIPSGTYSYEWFGPNNFESNEENLILNNVSSEDNGVYTLIVYNENCPSDPVETEINATDIPAKPEITGSNFVCEGDSLTLTGSFYSNPDIIYVWETPLGQITSNSPVVTFEEMASASNEGEYILTAQLGPCLSLPSDTFFVDVLQKPLAPIITGLDEICEGDTLKLFVNEIFGASYEWELNGNPFSFETDLIIPNVELSQSGEFRVRVILNGCVSDWSNIFELSLLQRPITPLLESDQEGICFGEDNSIEICISENSFTPGLEYLIYINGVYWNSTFEECFNLSGQNSLFIQGSNELVIEAIDGDCRSLPSEVFEVGATIPPNLNAEFLIDEISACDENDIILSAMAGPPDVTINWSSDNDEIQFTDQGAQETGVQNVDLGVHEIYLSYSFMSCQDFDIDTAIIILEDIPDAMDDALSVNYNGSGAVNVINNDIISSDVILTLIDQPAWGEASLNGNVLLYQSDPRFSGEVMLTYQICSMACPDVCDVAQVVIEVGSANDCFAPTIFTPNGDGRNDAFVVPCLSSGEFPNNELKVFNQYGDEVFGAQPYTNNWEGTFNGSDLPVGTYYYVIRFDNNSEPINGFLILER